MAARLVIPTRTWRSRPRHLLIPPAILMVLIFYAPISWILSRSVFDTALTGEYFGLALTAPVYLRILGFTVQISLFVTTIWLVIGYPVGYVLAHAATRLSTVLFVAVVVPLLTSSLMRSFAWVILLGQQGLINQLLQAFGF